MGHVVENSATRNDGRLRGNRRCAIEAHSPKVAAVAVTGKPFIFAVGADISGVGLINDRSQALAIAQAGHAAFRRIKNFACVEVHPQSKKLLVFAKVNPDNIELVDGFTRDVGKVGHFGTGDLEITGDDYIESTCCDGPVFGSVPATFHNDGTISKTGGAGATYVYIPFQYLSVVLGAYLFTASNLHAE